MYDIRRSQWPHGLRRGSAAARLLGLWFRIPPGHGCLSLVSVVCCQVEVFATGWSLAQRSPTECDREASIVRRPWPNRGRCAMKRRIRCMKSTPQTRFSLFLDDMRPDWHLFSDVSGRTIRPIFKCPAVFEDGTDMLSRNVG